jgi:glycosyltransferase involved in cell wall biosynthesis
MTPLPVLELRSVRGTGGGPEKTILLGAHRADRSRFAVTVCYLRDVRDEIFDIGSKAARLGVDYVEILERRSFDPAVWPKLRALVRCGGYRIVHSHDYKTDLLALALARTEGIVPLTTAHGWTGQSPRERWLYYPAGKRVMRAFPMVVAVSSEIRAELLRVGAKPERVRVILNGIDHVAFQRDRSRVPTAREALGFASDDLVIGAVGRVMQQKRFDLLIRAFARLRPQHPSLRLVIAGEGDLRPSLERLAASLLPGGSYRFLGHDNDVVRLHHAIDLFVQSSEYEGTPNAVLEAMALESPIVATAAGGTAELVEDGVHALIVPPNDVHALVDAIQHAVSDAAGSRVRAVRARRLVEGKLSFEARMGSLEQIYTALAGGTAQRRVGSPAGQCA